MIRNRRVPWIVLVAATLLATACAKREDAPPAPAAAPADKLAPEFTLTDVNGKSVSLADSKGRLRLVDFWATWCSPCVKEIPMLNEFHQTYGGQGLEILGISYGDEGAEVVRQFVEKQGIGYTSLIGTDEIAQQYSVLGLPTAYLIDGEGHIVKSFVGPKPRSVLEPLIRQLLELPPAT